MSFEQYSVFLEKNPTPRYLRTYVRYVKSGSARLMDEKGNLLRDFSNSDYLGLSMHPDVMAASASAIEREGVGLASSRLVVGNVAAYTRLENKIASTLKKEAALIFGSGYQTNASVLSTLLDSKVLGVKAQVFCDRLCHASIYAGIEDAQLFRFSHQNIENLRAHLEAQRHVDAPKWIIIESLYSMEGDLTDLKPFIELKKEFGAYLYVDDAHALGVYGSSGYGLCVDHADDCDVIMGTFSKALGNFGGYIASSALIREYLVNRCRGLIYATALPPPLLAAIEAAWILLPHLSKERMYLLSQAAELRAFMVEQGLNIGNASTHIIPWIVGQNESALSISEHLYAEGIVAIAMRPPTVRPGSSRVRFCLSAAHTPDDIRFLKAAIIRCRSN